jgi:hypothetical protein
MSFFMESSGNRVIFSRPREEYYAIKYGGKFGVIAMILISLVQMSFFPNASIRSTTWLYAISFMVFICLLMEIVFWRFAYRISFDQESGEVTLFLYRSKKPLTANIRSINRIHINFYIAFSFERRKVFYNEVVNKELVAFLEAKLQVPITWGRFGPLIHKRW